MGKVAKAVTKVTSKIGNVINNTIKSIGNTVQAIIKNPLPVIETAALITFGVPPSVASAAVTAVNGGSPKDIVNAGITAYAATSIAGSVASQLPEGTSATTVKIVSSAAGADAATTIKSLASGKSLDVALQDGLVAGASAGAGTAASGLVENKIGAGAAGGAAAGATSAALRGKDVVSGALSGAEQGAINPLISGGISQAKDLVSGLPKLDTGGLGDTLSGIKETVQPYVTAAKETLKPYYDPISGAVSNVAQSVKEATAPVYDAISGLEVPKNAITQAIGEAPNLYHDQQVIQQMAKTPNVPSISNAPASTTVAGGDISQATTGSPAAFGSTDVAMLDTTTPEGMGSKIGKKGGKYPWGDPEGTTALKQEGQVV